MKAKFLKTEGYALEATIEVAGQLYRVMDDVSSPGDPVSPGTVVEVEFFAHCLGFQEWEEVFSGNPEGRVGLEWIEGWKYRAYGIVERVDPVVVDCGMLRLEEEIQTHDTRCLDKPVTLEITCLGVTEAGGAGRKTGRS